MNIDKLSDEELQVYRDQMLDLLIAHGFCDDKRMGVLEKWVEAAVAWGWFKRTLLSIGILSGAVTGFGALILWFRSLLDGLVK
jgi:hypothetical protein